MSANGLLIDYEFCTGCQSCEISCKEERDCPVGKWGIRVLDEGPWEIEEGHYNWNKLPAPTDSAISAPTTQARDVSPYACTIAWPTS